MTECSEGVVDCAVSAVEGCADYDGAFSELSVSGEWPVLLVMAFIMMCVMSFGIGANDAANSWGTTVGSGALGLRQAVLLGGLFEWIGAATLGYGVSEKLQAGVSDLHAPECIACGYCDSRVYALAGGMFGALTAAACFLLLASFTSMPVSTTHAIVGGVVGAVWYLVGSGCLSWGMDALGGIVLSWVLSPMLSGALAVLLLVATDSLVMGSAQSGERALLLCPVVVMLSTVCVMALVLLKAPATAQAMPPPIAWAIALSMAVLAAVLAHTLLVPVIRAQFHSDAYKDCADGGDDGDCDGDDRDRDHKHDHEHDHEKRQMIVRAVLSSSFDDKTHCDSSNDESGGEGGRGRLSTPSPASPLPYWAVRVQAIVEAGEGAEEEVGGGGLGAVPLSQDDSPDSVASIASAELSDDDVKENSFNPMHGYVATSISHPHLHRQRQPLCSRDARVVFRYLLVITACLESFSHGSNDTANASAAFSFIYDVYATNGRSCADSSSGGSAGDAQGSPAWILAVAGFFVAMGVVLVGHRVIATMGSRLVHVSFQRGWCIEFSSAATVLLASVAGLPISSTHCQVGAVIAVGWVGDGHKHVNWALLGRIALTWALTLPVAGAVSAYVTALVVDTMRTAQ